MSESESSRSACLVPARPVVLAFLVDFFVVSFVVDFDFDFPGRGGEKSGLALFAGGMILNK